MLWKQPLGHLASSVDGGVAVRGAPCSESPAPHVLGLYLAGPQFPRRASAAPACSALSFAERGSAAALTRTCASFAASQGSVQEVIGWGLIGWKCYANVIGPIQSKGLANLGVTQIACAEKRFLILSRNGRVYTQAYNSDTLVGASCRCPRL